MAKKKPAPVDPQPGPTNLLLAMTYFDPTTGKNIPIPAKPGGFVLLSLDRPPEHVRGDVYFAWMEKLKRVELPSLARGGHGPLPGDRFVLCQELPNELLC